ncbi:SRPBCC family protein [Candidatus Thiosymbion oneisti]|uniref:SRPBCC family protein n=1 Tax=Candidatus Thiosymbion oneisti TaxID=589554 RepID=UPI000B7D5668|nr:SRPBCC family protein [Candidatus Thiosymbion oneisti]
MPKVTLSTELPASAGSVWNLIGGFNALPDWHPVISKSERSDDGSKRTLHVLGGGSIVEQLDTTGEGHRYSYSILKNPLLMRNYQGAIAVKPNADGNGCMVEWSGNFQTTDVPDNAAVRLIQGIYQVGLDNLSRIFGI